MTHSPSIPNTDVTLLKKKTMTLTSLIARVTISADLGGGLRNQTTDERWVQQMTLGMVAFFFETSISPRYHYQEY
jgi:hypothetical protein